MNFDQLRKLMPLAPTAWLQALLDLSPDYQINTPLRQAAWIGQLAEECDQFNHMTENLNYSAEQLIRTWPKHFPDLLTAEIYEHRPEAIANRAYADRMGNGDEASGDGWRYRGRGPIQITGWASYSEAGRAIGANLIGVPGDVLSPLVGVHVAAWFWKANKLNDLADIKDYRTMTQRINGGMVGYTSRLAWIEKALKAFS